MKKPIKKKPQPTKSTDEAQEAGSATPQKIQVTRSMTPELGYYHAKNVLWNQYQTEYLPLWTGFRNETTKLAELLGRDPARNHLKVVKALNLSRKQYTSNVVVLFENYINELTKAWIKDALAQQGISLQQAAIAAAQAAEFIRVQRHNAKLEKKKPKKFKFPLPKPRYTKK